MRAHPGRVLQQVPEAVHRAVDLGHAPVVVAQLDAAHRGAGLDHPPLHAGVWEAGGGLELLDREAVGALVCAQGITEAAGKSDARHSDYSG